MERGPVGDFHLRRRGGGADDAESDRMESGLEALRSSPEFSGPVEPLEDLDANQHIALFYESREEQFSAMVPFVRQGLARDERVMYVIHEPAEEEVLEAMRDGGIDVDAALESGSLSFHTIDETYLRTGTFDPDDMLDVYRTALETAKDDGYPGFRVTADTNWILDDATEIADFMEYESRVNDLFEGEDCIAICQYDLSVIPPGILRDVVRTHPHLIYDGTLCHNFYYTPPKEYFEPDEPAREVERMLGTLVDRTKAKVTLAETIEELEESNERLKRFAYVASHDLQEPLRMISSYLQLLEKRHADELDEEAQEYIDFAVDGADRMREMVDGLLAYSRIDMHDPEFEPVDCNAVLDDALRDLRVCVEETGAVVSVDDLPTVLGDANQLEQVFSNLIANALKYSDEPPRVDVTAERQGDRCVFAVADEGIGIKPEYLDQIFEIFNRLHSNDEYRGTGIGLTLCRKIVSHHGGDIWVDSEVGEGTTVYFTLQTASD